eukprot:TRINITY_DN4841_c1_g1_i1.p2 TRINITY_DN4841_c1_g1~~TRINITY_DN4841_c1_g1_i1.p2  ORF type:complete len:308 (+),score=107.02 TRINITY_DN4841_c1_g1_i1:210-1133(+)
MAFRNLTTDYQKIRAGFFAHRSDGGSGGYENVPIVHADRRINVDDTEGLPPAWVDGLASIRQSQQQIRQRMERLREMHKQSLKPNFKKDEAREQSDMQLLASEIKQHFKSTERTLRDLAENTKPKDDGEARVLQNIQISICTQMGEIKKQFDSEQSKFMSDLKRQRGQAKKLMWAGQTSDELEEEERRQQLMQQYQAKGYSDEMINQIMINSRIVDERDTELQRIYSSIVDLHEIFKDMNQLVIDQGSLLDRIDYNIDETRQSVTAAINELTQAEKIQKKSRFKLVVILLCVLILILIVALIFKVVF